MYGFHLLSFGTFSGKIINAGVVLVNWFIGIPWGQAETFTVNEQDVTVIPGFSNHVMYLDIDTALVEFPTPGYGAYALNPATGQGAGKVILFSGTNTDPSGAIIAIGGGFFGTWPVDFYTDGSAYFQFKDIIADPESELLFDAADNQDPFGSSKYRGLIRFENVKGSTKWICTLSKSIA